jgi:Peptidase family C25/Secretion system C-terminal sorting domain
MVSFSHCLKRVLPLCAILLFQFSLCVASQEIIEEEKVSWKIINSTTDGFSGTIGLNVDDSTISSGSIFNISENDEQEFVTSTMIAVPDGLGLEIEISDSDINKGEIIIGEPFLFRGIRLFPVQLKPAPEMFSDNEISQQALSFQANFTGNDPRASSGNSQSNFTATGLQFLRTHVINLDEIDLNVVAPHGRLLIVVQDNPTTVANLQDYVQWKTQQGYRVSIDHPDDSENQLTIKTLIDEHYYSDDPLPLEYILMIGDHRGEISMHGFDDIHWPMNGPNDYSYTLFDGEDSPVATVAIGRFSVDTQSELLTVINKTITYERDVYLENTDWLNTTVLTAGAYSGISPIQSNKRIKKMFADNDVNSDTLWFTMNNGMGEWQIPQFIINEVNEGASFVNYRGCIGMSGWTNEMCDQFTNFNSLPVVVTITCDTGTWFHATRESFIEIFLRTGTVNNPRGAVAAIGTATMDTHTAYNNIIDVGIFDAILKNNVRSLGWALVSAKYRLWEAYNGLGRDNDIMNFSCWNILMGDPSLRVWVGEPQIPTVVHADTLSPGATSLDVNVTLPEEWPELVWATIATDDTVVDSRVVPNTGNVRLYFDSLPQDENIYLTVCGDNVVPKIDTLRTVQSEILLTTSSIVVHDGEGGDQIANPGETITLDLTLTNSGTEELTEASAIVTSIDTYLNLVTSNSFDIPTLSSGSTVVIEDAVTLVSDGYTPDRYVPELTLLINQTYESSIRLDFTSWVATSRLLEPTVDENGDRTLMPGETVDISFPVKNIGSKTASGLTGRLISTISGITINNVDRAFLDMNVDEESNNDTDPFSITASNDIRIGEKINFTLHLTDDLGAKDSVQYSIYMGDPLLNGLTGSDIEYWAVDELDIAYSPQVEYSWIDIESQENRSIIYDSEENMDSSIVMSLPFDFTYFDERYNEITICSNGWAAFGSQGSINLQRNWPIPNPMGPEAMLAPFWDDLVVSEDDYVYTDHFQDEHLFVITWDCRTAGDPWGPPPGNGEPVKFQIVLFDPAFYPTETGNGIILFQYDLVSYTPGHYAGNTFATIGIESPDTREGVMYEYWQISQPGANAIGDDTGEIRTIVFTDDLTANVIISDVDPSDINSLIPNKFAISEVYPNPFNPSTTISVALPNSGNLKLKVFNLLGQEIASLANSYYSAGIQNFSFDADKMASGIYFVQASLPGNVTKTQKIMLVR